MFKFTALTPGYLRIALTGASRLPDSYLDAQYIGDIRDFDERLVEHVDAVIHLAAISTIRWVIASMLSPKEINHLATVRVAKYCAAAGVKHFVFASSCSVYGFCRRRNFPEGVRCPQSAHGLRTIETGDGNGARGHQRVGHDHYVASVCHRLRNVRSAATGPGLERLCRRRVGVARNHYSERRYAVASSDRCSGHGEGHDGRFRGRKKTAGRFLR